MKNSVSQINEHLLEQVKKAEVSPFLYTRIAEKIKTAQEAATPALYWSMGIGLALLMVINIAIFVSDPGEASTLNQLAQNFQLTSNNHLYR